jgi:hypothetical protein
MLIRARTLTGPPTPPRSSTATVPREDDQHIHLPEKEGRVRSFTPCTVLKRERRKFSCHPPGCYFTMRTQIFLLLVCRGLYSLLAVAK